MAGPTIARAEEAPETVILLHGIINRPFMMNKIEKNLEKKGFRTLNWGYNSTEKSIEEYAADLKAFVEAKNIQGPVHFVGFSLGSIIARYYLSTTPPPNLGRFVQIAPPNHGSPMVNKHEDFAPFGWIFGDKAIDQLRDGSIFLLELGVPSCETGIIVGGKGDEEGYNRSIPGDDDGTVAVESSRLAQARDMVNVKSQHTALLFKDETARQAARFLKLGKFSHEDTVDNSKGDVQ